MELAPSIVMSTDFWQDLYRHLIRVSEEVPHPDEQMAFILASVNRSASGVKLLAREMVQARAEDFVYQSRGGLEPKAEFVAATVKRCIKEGWHLIEVHSHPFDSGEQTTFSKVDWTNDRVKMPAMASILPEPFLHATMVVGQNALDAHFYDRAHKRIRPVPRVTLVGERLQHLVPTSSEEKKPGKRKDARYQRQELFFGEATQHALAQATIAIVGLGGLGSLVATQLAHLGVGHLILIDPDRVERSNLNRLFGAGTADLGRHKVTVYARLLGQISKTTRVTPLALSLLDREDHRAIDFARGADVLVGCVDNDGARLILNQLAVRYLIPLIDGGSGIHLDAHAQLQAVGGQVQRILPGGGCLECRGYINPQRAHFDLAPKTFQNQARAHGYGTSEAAPAVIYLNGIIASQQVAEIVYLLAETPLTTENHPQLVVYDAIQRKMKPIHVERDRACPTCGLEGLTGVGDFAPIEFATSELSEQSIEQIMTASPESAEVISAETVALAEVEDIKHA